MAVRLYRFARDVVAFGCLVGAGMLVAGADPSWVVALICLAGGTFVASLLRVLLYIRAVVELTVALALGARLALSTAQYRAAILWITLGVILAPFHRLGTLLDAFAGREGDAS